ncbi:hypothetical protein BIW11_09004 [Tropilaelaps mercedesae]|uniref:Uncharacterized protein n=1 Tax=Tropilaelaps mercedesae TaxID=418985 RepID=A0A1V9XME3_9ACAR|nr:hypothetical protein BIW11_09004 [Tropilaelaps mercedesae]
MALKRDGVISVVYHLAKATYADPPRERPNKKFHGSGTSSAVGGKKTFTVREHRQFQRPDTNIVPPASIALPSTAVSLFFRICETMNGQNDLFKGP